MRLQRLPCPCSSQMPAIHRSALPVRRHKKYPPPSAGMDMHLRQNGPVYGDHLLPHHDLLLKWAGTQLRTGSPLVQPAVRINVVVLPSILPSRCTTSTPLTMTVPLVAASNVIGSDVSLLVVLQRNALAIGAGVDGDARPDAALIVGLRDRCSFPNSLEWLGLGAGI